MLKSAYIRALFSMKVGSLIILSPILKTKLKSTPFYRGTFL